MSKFEGINVGDTVKVVVEGKVTAKYGDDDNIEIESDYDTTDLFGKHVVSVEKVAPPVITFKAGQRVRNKASGNEYTIGVDGSFSHQLFEYNTTFSTRRFTSDHFELVSA